MDKTIKKGQVVYLRKNSYSLVKDVQSSEQVFPVVLSNGSLLTAKGKYMLSGEEHPEDATVLLETPENGTEMQIDGHEVIFYEGKPIKIENWNYKGRVINGSK